MSEVFSNYVFHTLHDNYVDAYDYQVRISFHLFENIDRLIQFHYQGIG